MKLRLVFATTVLGLIACGDDPKPVDSPDTSDTAAPSDADASDALPDTADTASQAADASDASVDTSGPDEEVIEPAPREIFAFGVSPGQAISAGPFPSDTLRGPNGRVKLAPLGEDERFKALSKPELLDRTDAQIATRSDFGFISSVFFPMHAEPDLSSFASAVYYVALSGPEEGKRFPAQVSWFARARYLSVFPAWGHYLVPGSTYAVVIGPGVRTKGGQVIEAPDLFAAVMEADGPAPATEIIEGRRIFSKLREWLSTKDESAVVATVFTTENPMAWFGKLIEAADAFPLEMPTRHVAYKATGEPVYATDVDADGLDGYFGVPTAPFETTPTSWYGGPRQAAAALTGGSSYKGGSFRGSIGRVINVSIVVPGFGSKLLASGEVVSAPIEWEDGLPVARIRDTVPFTAYLCESHLRDGAPDPDKSVPFAIFTHGGTAIRADGLSFAVANCAVGYATIALDLPFHGGRQEIRRLGDSGNLVVPRRVDEFNAYSGLSVTDPGFVPDRIGDNGASTTTVGGMFALASIFDPDIIEVNLISIAVEAHVLTRYLADPDMLGTLFGTKIDASRLVMQSLSFGSSFTTATLAGTRSFVGAVQSVASGGMMTLNLPMAPNNAQLASGILFSLLGLQSTIAELAEGAYRDPMLAVLQWLAQKGDPQGYAPFVLRYRSDDHELHVLGSGDSWDETLFSPAQIGFNNAWGLPVYTAGADWTLDATIPGASTVTAIPFTDAVSNNLTFGTRTQSAGYFYNAISCHAQVVTPICESVWLPPYPPATPREAPLVSLSPVCALQRPMIAFLTDLLAGRAPSIGRPGGTCDELYAQ